MPITDLAVLRKSYKNLTASAAYPNHDSKALLLAFDPEEDFNLKDLNQLVAKGVQGGSPNWYTGWPKEESAGLTIWHRPMMRNKTVGERGEPFFDKLHVLEGDVLPNGNEPLAFTWPQQSFSKTPPIKVPKLSMWIVNDAAELDQSKSFVMEEVAEDDPEQHYDTMVTRKRMPVPKEFLDIVWEHSHPRAVLRLAHARIKELAGEDDPQKVSEVAEKFKLFVNHLRVANTELGRGELAKNIGDPVPLTTSAGRTWVSSVVNLDLAPLDDSQDSPADKRGETMDLINKTLEAVQESTTTTKKTVETFSEVVAAGIQGQAADKAPSNTPEGKWPTRLAVLKRMMGVQTTTQLPQVWHELAKGKAYEVVGNVQAMLDEEAHKMNYNLQFIVSARVIKAMVALQFCSRGDVEKGLNVFNSICPAHNPKASAITTYNQEDNWISGEKAVSSLSDHQAHESFKHAVFPSDATTFRENAQGMLVFYRVLLGESHPLTKVYQGFVRDVDLFGRKLTTSKQEKPFERALFGVHSRVDYYFEQLERPGTVADENLPDLKSYFNFCFHGGTLPEPGWFGNKGVLLKDRDADNTRTKKKLQKEKERALGGAIKNPEFSTAQKFDGGPTSKLIEKNGEPPKHEDGSSMCLIWHTKGE